MADGQCKPKPGRAGKVGGIDADHFGNIGRQQWAAGIAGIDIGVNLDELIGVHGAHARDNATRGGEIQTDRMAIGDDSCALFDSLGTTELGGLGIGRQLVGADFQHSNVEVIVDVDAAHRQPVVLGLAKRDFNERWRLLRHVRIGEDPALLAVDNKACAEAAAHLLWREGP